MQAEEEYQIEKGRLMQEQRASVNEVYDKKKSQNELLRKVWVLDFPLMPRSDHIAWNVMRSLMS